MDRVDHEPGRSGYALEVVRRTKLAVMLLSGSLAASACKQEEIDEHLVGGVDLGGTTCEQAYDKLKFCRSDASVLGDRAAFVATCEALPQRPTADDDEALIEDAHACFDRYTCLAYEDCMTSSARRAVRGEVVSRVKGQLAALGDDDTAITASSFANADMLRRAEYACGTLVDARDFESARSRCARVFEVGLEQLPVHADDMHCYALGGFASALGEPAKARLDAACKALSQGEDAAKVREHTSNSEWAKGRYLCEDEAKRTDGLEDACRAHAQATHDAMLEEIAAVFDPSGNPEPSDAYSACSELEHAAKVLGEDVVAETETLCETAEVAPYVFASFAKIEAALPFDVDQLATVNTECMMVEHRLDNLEGEWAEAQRERWFSSCVVERARVIFPSKIPKMKHVCSYDIEPLYEHLIAREYHDPDIDPWLAQAEPLCGKQAERQP